MDMKRTRRPQQQHPPRDDPETEGSAAASSGAFAHAHKKQQPLLSARLLHLRPTTALVLLLFSILLVLAALSGAYRGLSLRRLRPARAELLDADAGGFHNGTFSPFSSQKVKFLHGLLAAEFDERSCLSRFHSIIYREESPHLPSSYLLEKLRKYESLHSKCGPNTELYKKAADGLNSGRGSHSSECNYVVWISYSGLGNRMLSIASTFLYALLTNRVLLIDRGTDMDYLFCEPFPESTWILPKDFPVSDFTKFNIKAPTSYGNMLKAKVISNHAKGGSTQPPEHLPAYTYLHLSHDYGDYDKLFFCEEDQNVLKSIPWLLLRSNNYFVPSLFLIPKYEEELKKLFPVRDTVFHHLGRYLFHPTNPVWGLISRYYQSYLAKADERVGIQVRVFDEGSGPFQYVLDQILACSLEEKLLPDFNIQESVVLTPNSRSIALLMTSLEPGYFERIRNMYWEHPTATGEIISVHQPSYEGHQQTDNQTHNMKALAEIYLLSMTDMLITSAWSTFGYVAQGLGGLQPWILLKPENQTVPDPPCRRAMSIEPCFHAPPFYDCKAKTGIDTGILVPYVRHCEDMSWGLKLVNRDEW